MERSKLLVIAGSLVGAAIVIVGAVVIARVAIQHARNAIGRDSQLTQLPRPTSEAALKAAEPIDAAMIGYHETGGFPVAFRQPRALAVDADGQIYVGGDRAVVRYSGDGKKLAEIALQGEPRCLAVGALRSCQARSIVCGDGRPRRSLRSPGHAGRGLEVPRPGGDLHFDRDHRTAKSGLPTQAIASSGDSMSRANCWKPVGQPDPSQNRTGFLVTEPLLRPGRGNR